MALSGAGYAGAAAQMEKAPVEATLNDRLNKLSEGLQYHCDRLESVLNRVNGTPPTPTAGRVSDVAQIRPTLPMGQVVDNMEALHQRLANLASGVERIA